jgi:hypothetical protein
MAKKKSQDDAAEDDATEVETPVADAPPTPAPASAEVIAKVIADTNEEIRRFMPRLKTSEQEHRDLADQAKEAKKAMEGNHLHLSMLCGRLADAMNGNYQPLLFDAPTKSLPLFDEGAATPIGAMKDHGLTEKMVETLVSHDIATVGALEAVMRADEWWHRKIKGFGEDRITKVVDALMSFRSQHPIPSPDDVADDVPLVEQVTGELEAAGILEK